MKSFFTFILFAIPFIQSFTQSDKVYSLKDIDSIIVVIGINSQDDFRNLSIANIRTDVELKLRQVGIRVFDYLPHPKAAFGVSINIFRLSNYPNNMTANISITLDESVHYHYRLSDTPYLATTYKQDELVFTQEGNYGEYIRTIIKDLTDKFVNDYLKDNPTR